MARSSFLKSLLSLDKFGYQMEMHYQGTSVYRTLFGSLVSTLTYILILINALSISRDFISNENQTEVSRKINVDVESLGEQLFMENQMSIGWINAIPPEIGRVKASHLQNHKTNVFLTIETELEVSTECGETEEAIAGRIDANLLSNIEWRSRLECISDDQLSLQS